MEYEYGSVDFFREFYSPIDEKKWCTGILHFEGKHCAIGLLRVSYPGNNYLGKCLAELFNSIGTCVTLVNDGSDTRYKQRTPKKRLFAAFEDIRIKQVQEVNIKVANEILAENDCEKV